MVSQSQDSNWESSPSRTGSMLSLDGRQRPPTAKTPPSYYDAVRSRHSLSQPVNKPPEGSKQEKNLHVQQVKYNSLPRPLPQRYPPATNNGQQPMRSPWPDDHYNSSGLNGSTSWRPNEHSTTRTYDSPPKPANHVPLQLQVHQEKYLLKRGLDQMESCPQGFSGPRGNDQSRISNISRQSSENLTVNCNPRGNGMDMGRKEPIRTMPPRQDVRPPPPVPNGRPPHPRVPIPNGIETNTNSLPRRDPNHAAGLLRRCYPISPNGSTPGPGGYPPNSRPLSNGSSPYEPRYSKSGKLYPRPLSQGFESRPMPAPAVMLRTGPLGTYPDAETLKRSEMSSHNRHQERNYSPAPADYERQRHRALPQGDASQQIFVDTNSYVNGQSATSDHLAIPYRIPQVSPKNTRPLFDGSSPSNGLDGRKDAHPGTSPSLERHPSSPSFSNQQLSLCSRAPEERICASFDHRSRRHQEATQFSENMQPYGNQNQCPPLSFSKSSAHESRNHHVQDNDVIYANHQMSFHPGNLAKNDQSPTHQRNPPMSNGNGMLYDKQQMCPSSRNGYKGMTENGLENNAAVYANHMGNMRYGENQPIQQDRQQQTTNFDINRGNQMTPRAGKDLQVDRRNHLPPPPVAQKPRLSLPQPSEMIMVTETRGWNGQANSYSKDVVKPTPRMPRFVNGLVASGTQLTTVPAYQCVINELSSHPLHHTLPHATDTSSMRSGYASSSSSVRDFGRPPSKSDSSLEHSKLSDVGLKASTSSLRIDKGLLSASMTSLCSDASSSVSSRRRHPNDDNWDRMNEELQKRKEKSGSVFSASPWEREEKEKLQREQVLDARRARDQEIANLESIEDRSEKQEEWLRILRLEREFQRRAEQEIHDDDEGSVCSENSESDSEQAESFLGNKPSVISSERHGLKLLDKLDISPKSSISLDKGKNERETPLKSPSEKHFIPLELTIPDRDLHQPSSMVVTNNILQVSEPNSDNSRLSKPPVPAPRPSKAFPATSQFISTKAEITMYDQDRNPESIADSGHVNKLDSKSVNANSSSLTNLEISDTSSYFCSAENGTDRTRDLPQDTWLIEVNSFDSNPMSDGEVLKHNDLKEESRIYENVKPMDYHNPKIPPTSPSKNGFGSHTLPRSTSSGSGLLMSKETVAPKNVGSHFEKRFPTMGITSTLSKKMNGFSAAENDILPVLYASSKTRNGYSKDIPSDLVDKSPEFKKLWISRPEKLTFQDKIRKFSLQAGEDDIPRDRVKNSRAQREIENKFSDGQKKLASSEV